MPRNRTLTYFQSLPLKKLLHVGIDGNSAAVPGLLGAGKRSGRTRRRGGGLGPGDGRHHDPTWREKKRKREREKERKRERKRERGRERETHTQRKREKEREREIGGGVPSLRNNSPNTTARATATTPTSPHLISSISDAPKLFGSFV